MSGQPGAEQRVDQPAKRGSGVVSHWQHGQGLGGQYYEFGNIFAKK
jgi:hypothetical protein